MASLIDIRRQIDTLDRQIVELLGRRTALAKQIIGKSEEEIVDQDRERQVLSNWLEEGFEYDRRSNARTNLQTSDGTGKEIERSVRFFGLLQIKRKDLFQKYLTNML
jgi:chorismate mutase